jgi:hypothetical protein
MKGDTGDIYDCRGTVMVCLSVTDYHFQRLLVSVCSGLSGGETVEQMGDHGLLVGGECVVSQLVIHRHPFVPLSLWYGFGIAHRAVLVPSA